MTSITLTEGQQSALEEFIAFLADPTQQVFLLKGYSGTGKSTLVKEILNRLEALIKTARLINPNLPDYEIALTATTNKAAEALRFISGGSVSTIHSFLGLRVHKDYKTGESTLIPAPAAEKKTEQLIFIDEASFIDKQLLKLIFERTQQCKIVFMGDPAQLTPIRSSKTPVFDADFPGAELTEVVRQAEGNPIIELSTKFRDTVNTGQFFSFMPDGHHIAHLDRAAFNQEIEKEFTRDEWMHNDSKILAWRNNTVVAYNHHVRDLVKGDPHFHVGDYAICNHYVSLSGRGIKTDQMVLITGIRPAQDKGVEGNIYELDGVSAAFMPKSLSAWKARVNQAMKEDNYNDLHHMETRWIDLRAAYACTVDKSQGSTYDKVFIDLDDISRCNSGDRIARMLYVAVSRARHHVYLTGDLC